MIPAISENRMIRLGLFFLYYVSEGVPIGLTFFALPAYFAAAGVSPGEIGAYVGMATMPHAVKLINGPFMDRWGFLAMGRRRPWLIAGQVMILIALFFVGMVDDPVDNLVALTLGVTVVNFFVAFQDVAIDGMAVDLIPDAEKPVANSLMWAGQIFGISAFTALGAWLLSTSGIGSAALACSIFLGAILLITLLVCERPGERNLPWSSGSASPDSLAIQAENWGAIWRNIKGNLLNRTNMVFLSCILVMGMGRGLIEVFPTVFLIQEKGWLDTEFSDWNALARFSSGVFCISVGVLLMRKFGGYRSFVSGCMLMALLCISYGLFPELWQTEFAQRGFLFGYLLFDSFMMVAFLALFDDMIRM